MGVFRNLATLVFILCIPVALASTTVRYLVNEPRVYRYAIDQFDAPQTTGISRADLLDASADLRRYFNDNEDTLAIRVTQQGKEVSLFNPQETSHMRDVKIRFRWLFAAQEFSLLYCLIYVATVVLWAREVSPRHLAVSVIAGSVLTLVGVGITAAFAVSGFDAAWVRFHELLFKGNWRFNPVTDHLIQMFPPEFWQNIVYLLGLLVVAEAALILISTAIYLGVTSHGSQRQRLAPYYA